MANASMMKALSGLGGSLAVSIKFIKYISYDPAVPLFYIYPRETLIHIPRKVGINMFLETFFIITKKLLIIGKCQNKSWYSITM